jgi:hypothetical protein
MQGHTHTGAVVRVSHAEEADDGSVWLKVHEGWASLLAPDPRADDRRQREREPIINLERIKPTLAAACGCVCIWMWAFWECVCGALEGICNVIVKHK